MIAFEPSRRISPGARREVVDDDDLICGERFTRAGYLLAEVISRTDEDHDRRGGERWIDTKTRLYQAHRPCDAICLIEQERIVVSLLLRAERGWDRRELTHPDQPLVIPSVGLTCKVGDLSAETRWRPRHG